MSSDFFSVQEFEQISSTQDIIKERLQDVYNPAPEGLVICAKYQTKGRGRHGRQWINSDGNLYFSLLLKPKCDVKYIGCISTFIGLAIVKACHNFIRNSDNMILKWPNDILIDQKKCCGILIESDGVHNNLIENIIIGIGLNISSSPSDDFTYLQHHTDAKLDRQIILNEILKSIYRYYTQFSKNGFTDIKKEYQTYSFENDKKMCVKIGQNTVYGGFNGIDDYGNLLLKLNNEEQKIIHSGDVFIKDN